MDITPSAHIRNLLWMATTVSYIQEELAVKGVIYEFEVQFCSDSQSCAFTVEPLTTGKCATLVLDAEIHGVCQILIDGVGTADDVVHGSVAYQKQLTKGIANLVNHHQKNKQIDAKLFSKPSKKGSAK